MKAYLVAGVVIYAILVLVGIFALEATIGEALLYSAVLTVVGLVIAWWQWHGF